MITVFHRTRRGASQGDCFTQWKEAEEKLRRLFAQRIEAKAVRDDEVVGRVWKDNGHWNWYMEIES